MTIQSDDRRDYLRLLARQYPNVQAASSEIIHLQAILHLPKGTEHFMSDLHGEAEAFVHILNNASGAVREKVEIVLRDSLPADERAQLATLIYYPEEKLEELVQAAPDAAEWYRITLGRLLEICRLCASKYTRSKVRRAMPPETRDIINELLNKGNDIFNKREYFESVISTIIDIDQAEYFIISMCNLIKRLVVDHLHIVGDIFDRGPRADIIMDLLMDHHSVDIQWGNHDVLWMGAATGSRTCIATVLSNSITYNNLEMIETGYGISLRPLALFANEVYKCSAEQSCFQTKQVDDESATAKDLTMAARMHKAIAVIQFKLEGQTILRCPAFRMEDRLLLDKIDFARGTVRIGDDEYPLRDTNFPTIDPADPYRLSPEEHELMAQLKNAFLRSEKLQRHIRFLYSKGGLYKCFNGNLLYHGCIPMTEDGQFMQFTFDHKTYSGKALLDYAETVARQGYYAREGTAERQFGKDFLWFLWCGRHSPLFGRDHIATFERRLIADQTIWAEPKNPYYSYYNEDEVCVRILAEFGLEGEHCHIVNGHVPVKTKDGESPIKADGRLIVIDGGFCRAYQPTTGIAGYTLVYDSWGIHLTAHEPFSGKRDAIRNNKDILSTSMAFDRSEARILIGETDIGLRLKRMIGDLKDLLAAYRRGEIKEDNGAPVPPQ
ncbi:fructose-1,6-bisphosphatase [Butyricicoccus faecihominis]|uniref:fructose-1,6-bisphosphatase n=1 Tax=Butyricicoccus faecihominis TaxID=1712515 RepID=UPI002478BE7A|nr:fructose-1,6-bisphosphatase [Butyricicoccus faecihominis]MCQ5128983.1 fructose-1,6-bisphosphatase [Butyricicoccus faecihominis]